MEKEFLDKPSKFSVVIKQSSRGVWYLGYLRINADTVEEMDNLIDSALKRIKPKIEKLNIKENNEKPAKDQKIILKSEDLKLFEKLRQLRMEISQKENVPPYVVFHDSVLKHIAREHPKTKEEILKISGIAQKKFEKYGELFLKIVEKFEGAQ